MKKILSDLWQIAKKDLLEFRRDRIRLVTFIIMPIFMMILTGFIFPSQNSVKNISIGITNQDNQTVSNQLQTTIENLAPANNQKAFKVKTYSDLEAIKNGIKKQEVNGGLVIPSDFSAKLNSNQQAEVIIVEDQSNPQISALATQALSQVVNAFSQQVGTQKINQILATRVQVQGTSAQSFIQPIITKLEGLIPGETNYFEFVAPGIMAMVVMTAVLTGLAASVAREKEQGTLDGIMIAPISRLSIILGKATSQSIRGLIQGIIVMLLAIFLFGVTIHGNIFLVFLLLVLGIFSFVGLGILVSAAASEQETATQLLFMFQFPMLFLSGVFFPIQQMPAIMQKIAYVLPLTYAIQALRKVMILGAGIMAVRTELIILLVFGAVTLIIAVPLFRRMVTR
jgi:ABC-2 type transport system permease protein